MITASAHVLVILLSILFCADGCLRLTPQEEIIPMEFIVVTEENAADMLAEEPNEEVEPEPEPDPKPDPLPPPPPPEPEPDPLPPPPPKPEPPKPEPPKPTPPKPEPKKPDPPKKEKPKEKPKPKPIKIGKRVGPVTTGKKDPKKAATQKALSADEIAKLLAAGAKSGNKNQIPKNEASRCYGAIQRAFYDACTQYGLETSPTGRDPQLTISFGANGRVTNIRIAQSPGDRTYDNQVLQACRQVRQISGLSQAFLKEYKTVTLRLSVD
jgi:TonB family protein